MKPLDSIPFRLPPGKIRDIKIYKCKIPGINTIVKSVNQDKRITSRLAEDKSPRFRADRNCDWPDPRTSDDSKRHPS
jgi:hypothetical protein